MSKFIEIHNSLINIESISKVDFISDDIYVGLIPKDTEGNPIVDFVPFTFAQVELFTGQKIDLEIDLYWFEEGENEENWAKRNRTYINLSWNKLINSLGEVTKVTGYEYDF
jgi:hypothetical protein